MKFKFKVLIINIIVLSLAIGITGYVMIRINFNLALNTLVDSAISENNLAQTYVEFDLLEYINNHGQSIRQELKSAQESIESAILMSSELYIVYNDSMITDNSKEIVIPTPLLEVSEKVSKNYIIVNEDEGHFMYTASCNEVNNAFLRIITRKSVEDAYSLLNQQVSFFRLLLISILFVGSIIIYVISSILTKPLENLNKVSDEMADGNYSMRASVHSTDEIGQLAAKFNHMAASVGLHVNDLHNQIHRREQFVADFTHEIKTPMTTIIGYADTMRSMDLPREDQIIALNYIFNAGKRLEIMSKKLFEMIYLNNHDIELASVNTQALGQELAELMSPALNQKNITFEMDIENDNIHANKELLISAFTNFIDNARKASHDNGTITLKGVVKNNQYIFSVIDNGIGIAKEHLDKICNEFYMVDKSRSRKEGSAGLGLSLASLIIARHNGTLDIDSTEGVGTTITVKLPLYRKG